MNNKGQTLILFVILIPILITMLAVVVDVGILTNTYQKTKEVVDDGIRSYFEKHQTESIKNLLELNEIPTDNLEIKENENEIEVNLNYEISSLFGAIVNIKQYKMEIHRIGRKEKDKIIITKKE